MDLKTKEQFSEWAAERGIGWAGPTPRRLDFLRQSADDRYWVPPYEPRDMIAFLTVALDGADVSEGGRLVKRQGPWSFGGVGDADPSSRARDAIVRWTGIPDGLEGAVRFGPTEQINLLILLAVQDFFGRNVTDDLFLVPDHARHIFWGDHEGALIVLFRDAADVPDLVEFMGQAGFSLPTEPLDGLAWRPWMGPEPR